MLRTTVEEAFAPAKTMPVSVHVAMFRMPVGEDFPAPAKASSPPRPRCLRVPIRPHLTDVVVGRGYKVVKIERGSMGETLKIANTNSTGLGTRYP